MRRALIAATLILLAVTASAQTGDATATQEKRVRELLKLMRAGDIGMQMIDNMIASLKDSMPETPEAFWTGFRKRARPDDLVEMLVPIYMKNLSTSDVEEMIRFYSSPAGQHFLDKQPVIMTESMKAGQAWGERLATEAFDEMKKNTPDTNGH